MHKSFPFWPFLHCRFSLSSQSVWQSEGWVKIYNVKKVNTKMTCAPPKAFKIKNAFEFLQSSLQILAERVEPIFSSKTFFSWNTLECILFSWYFIQRRYRFTPLFLIVIILNNNIIKEYVLLSSPILPSPKAFYCHCVCIPLSSCSVSFLSR